MSAPSDTYIASGRGARVGSTDYLGGDKFPVDKLVSSGKQTERDIELLKRHNIILPLTRENYRFAVARREPGTIGRGFTAEELKELGIIDAAPAAPAPKPNPAPAEHKAGEPEPYKGKMIVSVRVGHFTFYEATNPDGTLLRAKRFRGRDSVVKFIDDLVALEGASDPAANPGTAEETEEAAHDDDLRPDTGDGQGPGPVQDR